MKINELLAVKSIQKVDEIAPLVPALAAAGGLALRGAASLGGAALRGGAALAKGVGGAVNTLGRAVQGANTAARAGKAAYNLSKQYDDENKKQDNKLKSTLSSLGNAFTAAGGGKVDINKTSQTLNKPPTNTPDPNASKNLEPMLPALSQALRNPESAELISQAIKTGVKADLERTAKLQQAQAKQAAQNVKAVV